MKLERPELLHGVEWFYFFTVMSCLFGLSIFMEYQNYANWTRFHSYEGNGYILQQYLKQDRTVLKVKSDEGVVFYTNAHLNTRHLTGYKVEFLAFTEKLTFSSYLHTPYLASRIITVYPEKTSRYILGDRLASTHLSKQAGEIFAALFLATPLERETHQLLSALGISHLLAISGFHLGLISALLYLVLRPLYRTLQQSLFPYRHGKRDIFIIIVTVLFGYTWYLEFAPALLRAFSMLIIGYILYDRGIRIVSLQTLLITVVVLLVLYPRLLFSVGYWLSVSGVFYILLYLYHFPSRARWKQFVEIHAWVYLMMLPLTLALFETFSYYHPLSIIWTMLFILFYPVAMITQISGEVAWLDTVIMVMLGLAKAVHVKVMFSAVVIHTGLALLSLWYKPALYVLAAVTFSVLVGAVYQIT